MPELPEVEFAARALERNIVGKVIVRLRALHPSPRRLLPRSDVRRVTGARVERVERRGKHQLLHLSSGCVLHVHFRMSGAWEVTRDGVPLPRYARVVVDLDDGLRISLVDPRALATVAVHAQAADALPILGPEADDPALTGAALRRTLAGRRGAIKPVLLDQRVLAGLGNIYAVEALWTSRIDPRSAAASLGRVRCDRLVAAMRMVIAAAHAAAGPGAAAPPLAVYGRAGAPCRRADGVVRRIIQNGRATYFCPACQRR